MLNAFESLFFKGFLQEHSKRFTDVASKVLAISYFRVHNRKSSLFRLVIPISVGTSSL